MAGLRRAGEGPPWQPKFGLACAFLGLMQLSVGFMKGGETQSVTMIVLGAPGVSDAPLVRNEDRSVSPAA